ncbi:hypothetical protein [Lentibacillus sp. Marseille-P4043]|uniref:hypothetical protein n=1 Tax=Lentibacillus sp. Marseille-P4043 TaxID=2040293 RepID=UPI000D0AF506|nr:hypothetical protein [Lentibacillus sp. Marseille-P4043]
MINYQSVEISGIDPFREQGGNEIYQNLRMLYTTAEGAVPFDRSFGINTDLLDEPLTIAKGRLMVEYRQKTKRFEPRVSVREVTFTADSLDGRLIPKVVIEVDPESQ